MSETHKLGRVSLENIELVQQSLTDEPEADFGLQVTDDGRVWICINGVALIRFSPHRDGAMFKARQCEARHVLKKDDQCSATAQPGMKACARHKCSVRECPNVWSVQLPFLGLQYCSNHSYLQPR